MLWYLFKIFQASSDQTTIDILASARRRQCERPRPRESDRFDRLGSSANVHEVRRGDTAPVGRRTREGLADGDEPTGIAQRKWPKHDGIEKAEHGRRHADAQAESEERRESE